MEVCNLVPHCESPARGFTCVWRHQIMTSVITISRVLAKAAEQSSLCSYLNIVFWIGIAYRIQRHQGHGYVTSQQGLEMIRVFCFIDHLPRGKKTTKRAADDAVLQVFDTLVSRGKDAQESLCLLLVQAQGWASLVCCIQAHFLWVTFTL